MESLVEPVLLYANDIWGISDFGKIKTVQNKAYTCIYIFGLGQSAANIASQDDIGWSSCFVSLSVVLYIKEDS